MLKHLRKFKRFLRHCCHVSSCLLANVRGQVRVLIAAEDSPPPTRRDVDLGRDKCVCPTKTVSRAEKRGSRHKFGFYAFPKKDLVWSLVLCLVSDDRSVSQSQSKVRRWESVET